MRVCASVFVCVCVCLCLFVSVRMRVSIRVFVYGCSRPSPMIIRPNAHTLRYILVDNPVKKAQKISVRVCMCACVRVCVCVFRRECVWR